MPLEFPLWVVVTLNVVGWPVIQLSMAWVFTRLPQKLFAAEWQWARPRALEAKVYARIVRVRQWKRLLPDGAPWVKGFAKQNLRSKEARYLKLFISETRRGEAAHWVMILFGTLFFLWNPLWADAVLAGYGMMANVPCIVTQRYNRFRLEKVLQASRRRKTP